MDIQLYHFGYIGVYETTKLIKGVSHTTSQGHEFAIKLMNALKNATLKWKKETGLGYLKTETPHEQ